MVDPGLEEKIKKTKEFMELWMKFRQLYSKALRKETILPEEEIAFLETKSLLARKYQALMDRLDTEPSMDDKTFDVISQVLSLQGVSSLSDVQIQEVENGWHRSFIFLNKLLGSLENRKETLAQISPLSVWGPNLRAVFRRKKVRLTLLILLFLFLAYWVNLWDKLMNFLTAFGLLDWIQGFFPAGTK